MVPHRVVSHRHSATTGGEDYLVEYRGYPPFCHDDVRDAALLQIAPRLVDAYVSDLYPRVDRGHVVIVWRPHRAGTLSTIRTGFGLSGIPQ